MRWARLHFGNGDTLELVEPIHEWRMDEFERRWREVHVRVEWLWSPRGRLDHILGSVMRNQQGWPIR